MGTARNDGPGFRLPLVSNKMEAPPADDPTGTLDIDAALKAFEDEERAKLGLPVDTNHWYDKMIDPQFSKTERSGTTLLIAGLTAAHDFLIKGALTGLGYNVEVIDVPDNDALRYGKEFGNRGQCNPTYFTVGNLVKCLSEKVKKEGITHAEAVQKYVFVTAGACGPCRFGMYATEYRKALRDAGFDGFRVMLFQQKGGLKQATGEEAGLNLNPAFFMGLLRAIIAGDVINGMGYRLRPFEVEKGATDRAIEATKKRVYDALSQRKSVLRALFASRGEFAAIKCDWTRTAPRVSIIGEFWAMTTEGDGNYFLQRFLEQEGAECDIQFVTNWLLYMLWEGRYDTKLRADLRGLDKGRRSLKDSQIGKKLFGLFAADMAVRAAFHTFGAAIGFWGYILPDMDEVAEMANGHYNNQVRGGEGHMEVGKFILNVLHNKSHMTLSVKPFGCMPSSGVSDGVQSLITAKYPQSIFCAIETSGDGKVNVHSRVQMFLFKARLAAQAEYTAALEKLGITEAEVAEFFAKHKRFASPLHRAPHAAGGTAADRLAEIAPLLGKSPLGVRVTEARALAGRAVAAAKATPGWLAGVRKKLMLRGPDLVAQAREEWVVAKPIIVENVRQRARDGLEKTKARFGGRPAAPSAPTETAASL
jgi:predicted nucleotide-binding protein (sugar kinase/HSP70/actin superfamily)